MSAEEPEASAVYGKKKFRVRPLKRSPDELSQEELDSGEFEIEEIEVGEDVTGDLAVRCGCGCIA